MTSLRMIYGNEAQEVIKLFEAQYRFRNIYVFHTKIVLTSLTFDQQKFTFQCICTRLHDKN